MKNKIVLFYPRLGRDDMFVKDIPLSLLYAAAGAVEKGYPVEIVDLRIERGKTNEVVERHISPDVLLAGVSVMTGEPIRSALEITNIIKEKGDFPVVWGGPHPTVVQDETLSHRNIDYLIKGFGSQPLLMLAERLSGRGADFKDIPGLSYKAENRLMHNPINVELDGFDFSGIPYRLIEKNIDRYFRFNHLERVIPIYTSMGCPHKCTFCISPAVYRGKRPWTPFPVASVLDHIGHLVGDYKASYISVYDDDSFVDLERMKQLLTGLLRRGLIVRLGFRGVRVDEVLRMDEELLGLMDKFPLVHLHIGAESGSEHVLGLVNKKIEVSDILRANRKLSSYPRIVPLYNTIVGVPMECLEDSKKTADLLVELNKDNENCITPRPCKYRPLPGTELFRLSKECGFSPPRDLEGWIGMDCLEEKFSLPWYTGSYKRYIDLLQTCSCFLSKRVLKEISLDNMAIRLGKALFGVFRRVALFRLRHNFYHFLVESYFIRSFIFLQRKLGYER